MEYTTRPGSGPLRAHVNYQCPCGCTGGVIYNSEKPLSKAGACCCGRKLWVGEEAEARLQPYLDDGTEYVWDIGSVTLPWGEVAEAAMAWPKDGAPAGDGHGHSHDDDDAAEDGGHGHGAAASGPAFVLDVVCGMRIDPATAAATSVYGSATYYFCATSCKQRFDADPASFVQPDAGQGLVSRLLGRLRGSS